MISLLLNEVMKLPVPGEFWGQCWGSEIYWNWSQKSVWNLKRGQGDNFPGAGTAASCDKSPVKCEITVTVKQRPHHLIAQLKWLAMKSEFQAISHSYLTKCYFAGLSYLILSSFRQKGTKNIVLPPNWVLKLQLSHLKICHQKVITNIKQHKYISS